MKKISTYFLYCSLFTLILIACEKLYDFFLLENHNIKTSYITKEKVNADVLILGNCVPYTTISPEIIEEKTKLKTYNLAEHNADFAENYLSIYLYLKNNKAPKFALLYISPETFDDRYNSFNSCRFSSFLNEDVVAKVIQEEDPKYYKWTAIPFMKYGYYNNQFTFNVIQGGKHYFQKRHTPYLKDGFNPHFNLENKSNIAFNESYVRNQEFKWSKTKEKYLIQLIQLAQKKKIKLIFYESPMYTKLLKFQANRKDILDRTKRIANAYKIDYLVFDTMEISNSKKNFISTNSMNYESSKKFTILLSNYIK